MREADVDRIRFLRVLNECRKHVKRLNYAFSKLMMKFSTPFDAQSIIAVVEDEEMVESLDQITYRFSKLQDSMGQLFRYFLINKGENTDNMTMIDMVHYLDKIGVDIDADEWFKLREMRNIITHEYEDESEKIADVINRISEKMGYFKELLDALDRNP